MKSRYFFLLMLILIASFFRLFRFREHLEFLDDQGRDAIVIKQILVDHKPTLLGPGTSVGKMYLGPLYYYAMVPFLALTYPDPSGPAYAMAFFGILTTVLVYEFGKVMVGERAAKIASLLYAVAPATVLFSRFSWQPNPTPCIALLMLWFSYLAILKNRPWLWVGVATCFAILSQLHYVALLSAVPAGLCFAYHFWITWKNKGQKLQFVFVSAASLLVIFLSTFPLVLFDYLHGGIIRDGFAEFFTSMRSTSPISERIVRAILDSHGRGMYLTVELLGFDKKYRAFNTISFFTFIGVCIWTLRSRQKGKYSLGMNIIALWFFASLIGLTLYRNTIHVHYVAYLFPVIFLLSGMLCSALIEKHRYFRYVTYGVVGIICIKNAASSFIWTSGASDMDKVHALVADTISHGDIPKDATYNIALLNDNREYKAMKYRYFFEVSGQKPQSQYDYTRLDRLIVITENGENPLKTPIYEVQQFARESEGSPKLVTQRTYQDIVKAYIFAKK